jgi:drug/metabolite transporter (DMT)-like permease
LVVGAIGGEGLVVSPLGVAWGLASAVFFAFYSLMGSVASTRFSPYTVLVYGLGFATLFWLALLGPRVVIEPFADLRMAGAILFMAVVSTVVPFAAFLLALRHIPPTNATVTSTVEPLLAGLGAFALFGESFSRVQLVGGVLVIAAIAVVQLPERGLTPILPPPD